VHPKQNGPGIAPGAVSFSSFAAARKWPLLVMHEPMKASSILVPATSDQNLASSGSLGHQTMGYLIVGKNFELQHA
jgi:hypothetical protein